jgi:hypothetical protein
MVLPASATRGKYIPVPFLAPTVPEADRTTLLCSAAVNSLSANAECWREA